MKEQPEIAPEIRGLLEEIVADPRSSMRLTPKRALSSWFDSGEMIRPSEVSGTKAERHLVEAHREALAQLLIDATQIAYWKSPGLGHRPIGDNGQPFDPASDEGKWRRRAVATALGGGTHSTFLARLISGINADDAHELAVASLGVVPSDSSRCYVAMTIPSDQPRAAIRLFSRLAEAAEPTALRPRALTCLASRMCAINDFGRSVEAYRRSAALARESSFGPPFGAAYAFNLSCFLGSISQATAVADELTEGVRSEAPWLIEATRVIALWAKSRSKEELSATRSVAEQVASSIGGPCEIICGAYEG